MNKQGLLLFCLSATLGLSARSVLSADSDAAASDTIAPEKMPAIGTVDERYQSYNVEMLEVTGGKFWRPYGPELDALLKQPPPSAAPSSSGDTPVRNEPSLV